jgi:predicted metal-dependent peptidase
MSKNRANEEISRCINKLLLKEPFYAHIISGTIRKITNEIETVALGLKEDVIFFMVNETYFLKELTSTNERVAVIKHEILHLVFRHLFRAKKIEDIEIYNIAADLVVNQYIGQHWKLPTDAVTIELFPDLKLIKFKNLEYYYQELYRLYHSISKSKVSEGNSNLDENDEDDELSNSKKILLDIYGKKRHSNHSYWCSENKENETSENEHVIATKILLNKQIQSAYERASAKNKNELPDQIKLEIDCIGEELKPMVDWRRVLKIFSGQSSKTKIQHTSKRISKRFGTRPGIKIKQFNKIAVIVDTSGSIDNQTLLQFFFEIEQISRMGTDILVIECDNIVGKVYAYSRKITIEISGRGGTNYDPAFEYINQNKKLKINSCIYLTDGLVQPPKIKPRCNLLYVITPDGSMGAHLKFGRYIQMRK